MNYMYEIAGVLIVQQNRQERPSVFVRIFNVDVCRCSPDAIFIIVFFTDSDSGKKWVCKFLVKYKDGEGGLANLNAVL